MEEEKISTDLKGFSMADFVVDPAKPAVMVVRKIIQVPVKKPNNQKYFRVLPGSDWEVVVPVLELKEESEFYLVHPSVLPYIQEETKMVKLHLACYTDGTPFLIPVPLPPDGDYSKWNSWHRSLAEVVKAAQDNWVRSTADRASGGYKLRVASGDFTCPSLPEDMILDSFVMLGFKDRIIDSVEHPVVKKLLGLE